MCSFLSERHEPSGTDDKRSHSQRVCLVRWLPHFLKWNIKEVQSASQPEIAFGATIQRKKAKAVLLLAKQALRGKGI
jgi:hypothetical protein